MMKRSLLVLGLAITVPMVATADDKTTQKETKKKLGADETKIVSHLHHVNQMEVDLGGFAIKTGTPAIKKYAQMLVDDHSSADKELTSFAKARGLATIPADKGETEAEKMAMKAMMDDVTKMKKLKGADFDRAYLLMMVDGHSQELANTDAKIAASQDDDLDAVLQARKAVLTRHIDGAKELQKTSAQASK